MPCGEPSAQLQEQTQDVGHYEIGREQHSAANILDDEDMDAKSKWDLPSN